MTPAWSFSVWVKDFRVAVTKEGFFGGFFITQVTAAVWRRSW